MKRILLSVSLALYALGAAATTLNPIQLLNPAGSTSGQAIVSTGASSAPAWASVTAGGLVAQAANTVVANVTAASASPTAVALPSCSTANSALKYTTSTGFSCGTTFALTSGTLAQFSATTSAQLASVISDETGSGSAVFGTSPTISTPAISGGTINSASVGATTPSTGAFTTLSASSTVSGTGFSTYLAAPPAIGATTPNAGTFTTVVGSGAANFGSLTSGATSITGALTPSQTAGIVGTTTNNNANAGSVGEYISSTIASGSAVPLTTVTPANVTSISLTAGDWDVFGAVNFSGTSTTGVTFASGSISLTSATTGVQTITWCNAVTVFASVGVIGGTVAPLRVSVASTTTVYLIANQAFGGSTMAAYGFIAARRRR